MTAYEGAYVALRLAAAQVRKDKHGGSTQSSWGPARVSRHTPRCEPQTLLIKAKSKRSENMKKLAILVSFTQAASASIIFCGEQKHLSKIHILTSLFYLQLPSIPMCWQQQCQEAIPVTERLNPPMELHLPKRLLELDALVHIDRDPATQMYCYPQCPNQSRLEEVQFLE